jgi:Tfp pilus assembly protein PilO
MTTRDRTILMVLAALAAVAGFWFVALAPKRSEVARLDSDLAVQRDRLQTAQATAADAGEARARYAADYATVVRLGKAVPTDDEMPSLLYQLEAAADGAKVDFRSITRSGGAAGAAPGGSTDGAAATSAQSGSSSAGATGSGAASTALPPGATVGSAGLATLPFSFTFRGSYFQLEKFLRSVDGFVTSRKGTVSVRGRLLTVDGLSLAPAEDSFKSIEARVTATAYLQPEGSAASASAATSGGSATPATDATAAPTQTASATPSGAQ